jgi:dipeptidyl aminopeptidase/acylaminoacyl peptidase
LSNKILDARRVTLVLVLACLSGACFAQAPAQTADAPAKPTRRATVDDFYSILNIVDTAISLNGQYMAAIVRRDNDDVLLVLDLATGKRNVVQRVGHDEAGKDMYLRMTSVAWKTDDKMLVRLRVRPKDVLNYFTVSTTKISKMGDRLFAVNRADGKHVALLADNRNAALEGAFNLGDIRSFLHKDPQHILMELDGFNGRSLFKVNIETGRGELMERPMESVTGWWLDIDGNPVVRMAVSNGTVRLSRKDEEKKWRVFYKMRLREMEDSEEYMPVGPSNIADKYYVLATPPGHDRKGIYLYDLTKEEFGEPVVEHPKYDIDRAMTARDGTRVLYYCYTAHVEICEFTDTKFNAHMRGLRKYFEEFANVTLYDASQDDKNFLLYVEGPHDPPGYFYYQSEEKNIQIIGAERKVFENIGMPKASVVNWKARDGKEIHGYLTLPPGAPAGVKLPLIVHPHGGPEARDQLTFDRRVQFFAARGYAVFQPNFRGSAGFGKAFAESGYGEWGRKMQDDITDGVQLLVEQGVADPARMCIVGASYGGYAALVGASLTPDLYKCAVSIAGVSDLEDFISWRKRNWGSDSEGYRYWLKAIGDPDKDEQKLKEVSPLQLVDKIKIPVLLLHGTDDFVVPIAQSRAIKKALDRNGKKTELLEFEKEGHSGWQPYNYVRALSSIDQFLWKNLGPGYGATTPPPTAVASK